MPSGLEVFNQTSCIHTLNLHELRALLLFFISDFCASDFSSKAQEAWGKGNLLLIPESNK